MKRSKKILLSVMTLVVTVALCACGGDKGDETSAASNNSTETNAETVVEGGIVEGGEITVGITQDLDSLDPHKMVQAGTREVLFNVFEGLVKADSDGNLVPAVASEYEISEDAKEYTFTLRDGITFHDGSAVTVEDIKYSIERYAEINSSAFSILESVEAVDESTIKVTLSEGNSEFLSMLSLEIVPQSNEANFDTTPIGTGPFKFVSYTPGQELVLEGYEGYWKQDEEGRQLPYLDKVTYQVIADNDTGAMQLQAGTLDILQYLSEDQVATLPDTFNIIEGSINYIQGFFMSQDFEPFKDIRVRQAMNYVIDKQAINDFIFNGKAHILGTHMIPAMGKYYNEETETYYTKDVEKAKELLKEAGYENGFDLTISVPSNYTNHVSAAEIIVENLKEVNINAKLDLIEMTSWTETVYQGRKFEATVIAFTGKIDPSTTLRNYYSESPTNFCNYSSEAFDKAYLGAKASIVDEEKIELYKECQMVLAEEAVAVYIEDPANLVAMNSKLAGYEFYPISAQDLSLIHFVE